MSDTTYNGWTNYETWNVNLWIDNSQGDQEYWSEQAQECVQEAIDGDESDIKASATYALSQRLEASFDDASAEMQTTGVFADLLTHALGMVNWYEIAKGHVDEITLYSAGWNMPGYMPDNTPSLFLDADDAMSHIQDAAKNHGIEYDNEASEEIAADEIEAWKADSKGEFGQTFGQYHYFVSII